MVGSQVRFHADTLHYKVLFSKELYHLRVTERLFEISSKGEKGGAHVYKLKAA